MSSSADLDLFRDLRSRSAERRVRGAGGFFAESPVVVSRLMSSGVPIRHLIVSERRRAYLDAMSDDVASTVLGEEDLYDLVGFEMHRGVIAVFERPETVGVTAQGSLPCVVILEGINDADNLGSLVRTAVALGVTGFVCDATTADLYTRRCVRVSMGTVGAASVSRPTEWPPQLNDRMLVAMAPNGLGIGAAEWSHPLAVAFGAEGGGLSQGLMDAADAVVGIPMSNGVDSVNVSHAAAIALHHFNQSEPPTP